jgi:3D (Asp-Asp-Asp) domain-containing protein
MKNLVRGSVILSIISVFVVFIYAQTTETVSDIAKDSQIENNNKAVVTKAENLTETNIEPTVVEVDKKGKIKDPTKDPVKKTEDNKIENTATAESKTADDKKLVTKTASSKAAGRSRGKFVATAYCLRGRTASGAMVRKGIIAADPRVLKLGSRVNLGAGNYTGDYLVADTGGKIKGNRIDIWMASCAEARRFGRRTVTVYTP